MKKELFYCCLVVILICTTPFLLFAQETGDVNNDSTVNIIDALLVAQYYVGSNPAGFYPDAADTNCDDTINIVDALLIAQYYVGLVSDFPVCGETPTPTPGPTTPIYVLHLTAVDADASEEGPDSARLWVNEEFIGGAADGWNRVYYSITGTATNGVDYEELTGEVWVLIGTDLLGTPPPGEPDRPPYRPSGDVDRDYIDIIPIDDTEVEGDETVTITLDNYENEQVTVVIKDNDTETPTPVSTPAVTPGPTPTGIVINLTIKDADASEEGPDNARLLVTEEYIGGAADGWSRIYYSVSGTAENGVDYEELPGEVWVLLGTDLLGTPPPGEPNRPPYRPSGDFDRNYIDIIPIDDMEVEGDETVTITLTIDENENVTVINKQATVTIKDNDTETPAPTIPPGGGETSEPTPTGTSLPTIEPTHEPPGGQTMPVSPSPT
jgi:hypothetical protein